MGFIPLRSAEFLVPTWTETSNLSRALRITRIVTRSENGSVPLRMLPEIQDEENDFDLGKPALIAGDKSRGSGIRQGNIFGPDIHEAFRRLRLCNLPQMRCNRSQVRYVRIGQMEEQAAGIVAKELLEMHRQFLARPFLRKRPITDNGFENGQRRAAFAKHEVTSFRPRKRVTGVERWRLLAAASTVVERRQASAPVAEGRRKPISSWRAAVSAGTASRARSRRDKGFVLASPC
jgi:hypothetical protein